MAGSAPRTRRCAGVYGPKHRRPEKIGEQCEIMLVADREFCHHHFVPDERRCTAHYSPSNQEGKGGQRCTGWAMQGQMVCGFHGGKTPQAKAAAARRIAEEKVTAMLERKLARLDVDPVENPLTALSKLAGQVVAWQEALAERVNALTELRYQGGSGEQLRAEIALYERAMDRCNTVLGTIARLNIDERLMKIEEKKAAVFMEAIQAGLVAAGLTPEQTNRAKQVIAQKLRAVRAA